MRQMAATALVWTVWGARGGVWIGVVAARAESRRARRGWVWVRVRIGRGGRGGDRKGVGSGILGEVLELIRVAVYVALGRVRVVVVLRARNEVGVRGVGPGACAQDKGEDLAHGDVELGVGDAGCAAGRRGCGGCGDKCDTGS